MGNRLKILGVIVIIIGLVSWGAAAYAYMKVQEGSDSLQGFSEAQGVQLSYNDEGELIDRGTTEGAEGILELLGETWGWPINEGELDPNDPLVDTGTEYMYQMATIAYHTLHGTQTVVLTERVEVDGDGDGEVSSDATVYSGGEWDPTTMGEDAVFLPGTYQVPVNERYWTGFNRLHPLDGPARAQAWSGTVHGLFGELGVGAASFSSLQLGLGVAGVTALMGLGFVVLGGGLVWIGTGVPKKEEEAA